MDDLKMMIAGDHPDVMMFTEVIPKAQRNPIDESLLKIDGYELFTNFEFSEKNLGASGIRGVAIYVKNEFNGTKISLDNSYKDHIWVEIPLNGKENLLCGCVYRSPAKDNDNLTKTTSQLSEVLKRSLQLNKTNLLICGDFNYPEINWESEFVIEQSPTIGQFIDTIQELHLCQHVVQPTRYRLGHDPSLLDLILTNEDDLIQELDHKPGLGESDHECLYFNINCYKNITKKGPTLPNYYKADYNKIQDRLKDINWYERLNGDSIEDYETFMKILKTAMDGLVPTKTELEKQRNMYMTREAMKLRDLKCKLWRRYTRARTSYNRSKYIRTKNSLRQLTRDLRYNFESNVARDVKTAPKKFWAYVKSRTKTRSAIPALKKSNGMLVTTPEEKAETLNEFFSSVFTMENIENLPEKTGEFQGDCLDVFFISKDMVIEKLNKLNPNKSSGPDGWHPVLLKNIADCIALPLSIVFQKSLNEGKLPSDWLKACITAIFKKGDKSLPNNYRPVSITSIICKLMESIVKDKLVSYMVKNDLFSKNQHGFVSRRECITNLLTCIEIWTNIMEDGDTVDVIYTDFAKAFDSVPHQRLIIKLETLGIKGRTLNWIKSFLSNRTQQVRVDGMYSKWKPVLSGIPQGSILGPILFLIYINDMPEVVKSMCILFADDAKLFGKVNVREEDTTLQNDIDSLVSWSEKWQLPFNTDKCKTLNIGQMNPFTKYKMGNVDLKQIHQEKDLGIIVDRELKFREQAASAIKTANSRLGMVKKTFSCLNDVTLPLLYKSIVRPHLEYGNIIWGPFNKEDVKNVERVQRRATKTISNMRHLNYEHRLRKLNIPSLQHRRKRGDMIYAYKLFTGKLDLEPTDFFQMAPERTRGHKYRVLRRKATKRCKINAFSNRIITDWNSLPMNLVDSNTVNLFKNKIDTLWKSREVEYPA